MTAVPRPARALRARRFHERRRARLAGRRDAGGLPRWSPTSRPRVGGGMVGAGSRRPTRRCCCRSGSGRPGSRPPRSGGWPPSRRSRWPRRPRRRPGCPPGPIRLKWPNDLVIATRDESGPGGVRKIGGVLGETDRPRDRRPARRRRARRQRRLGRGRLPDGPRGDDDLASRAGRAPHRTRRPARRVRGVRSSRSSTPSAPGASTAPRWAARQVTTGREVRLETRDGHRDGSRDSASTR